MDVNKDDLQWAASKGCITSQQATELWSLLQTKTLTKPEVSKSLTNETTQNKFDLSHVAYYIGALVVIVALGWFVGLGWERFGGGGLLIIALLYALVFFIIGNLLWRHDNLRTPGGLFITLAVCMTPLAIYGFQKYYNLWIVDEPGSYSDFVHWVKGGWFAMEIGTVITSALALYFYRFPFLTAPLFFTLWFMSMDVTPLIYGSDKFSWDNRLWVSLWFGLGILILAYIIDRRTKQDFAFWGYLFGMFSFWGGLSLMESESEWSRIAYCAINVVLVFLAPLLQRNVFLIFGGLGIFGYLSSLFYRLFYDSTLFPFVLSVIGVLIIILGILYQKYHRRIEESIHRSLPNSIKRWLPHDR